MNAGTEKLAECLIGVRMTTPTTGSAVDVRKVYAVAHFDYESTTVYAVYESEADAEATIKLAQDYCAAKPRPEAPRECVDTPENNAAHAKWWRALERWEKKHPFGKENAYYGDDWNVWSLPFYAALRSAGAQ